MVCVLERGMSAVDDNVPLELAYTHFYLFIINVLKYRHDTR